MALHKLPFRLIRQSQRSIEALKRKIAELGQKSGDMPPADNRAKKAKAEPKQKMEVSVSIDSVIKASFAILGIVALAYLLLWLKSIILLFLVALFLSAAFSPAVDRLERHHVPRALGIVIMYVIVLGVLVFMFSSLVPIIALQLSDLAVSVKDMVRNVLNDQDPESWFMMKLQPVLTEVWQNVDQTQIVGNVTQALRDLASKLTDFAGNAIGAIFTIFNGIFNLLLVLVISFFMILNKKDTGEFFNSLFPRRYSAYINEKTREIGSRIGEWVRGQMLLGLAMGLLTFIVFSVIRLDYALTLALVSAIAEFIPYLGPLITFGSALLIALNQDPVLVLWLIPAYAIMQILEGNVLVPLIIGKSVGLNPIVILFAMLSGATIGVKVGGSLPMGLVGMMLAVPVANIISIFVEDYTEKNK